jgi:predicted negative regulator of RcsB-dependent stress response
MSKSKQDPSTPPPNEPEASAEAVASGDLEEVVQQFWEKNRSLLMLLAVVVLVAIVGRNGWAYYQQSQLESAREAYAQAGDAAALEAFAADHAGTGLAGVALLKVADEAYTDGRYADALAAYEKAAGELADTVFADRITLGQAMTQLASGDTAGGQAALQALANNTDATIAVRSEAVYHLAGLALSRNDTTELAALATQVEMIDAGSNWAQRVTLMQTSLGVEEEEDETVEISVNAP